MPDQRSEQDEIRKRFDEGAQPGAPIRVDGQSMDAFFADARREASQTDEGRLILLDAEIAKQTAVQAQNDRDDARLTELDKLIAAQLPPEGELPEEEAPKELQAPSFIGPRATGQIGLLEIGGTFLMGALGELPAGLNLMTGFFTGGVDQAVRNLHATRDAFTFQPKTGGGKAILQGIGTALVRADDLAAQGSAAVSLGNPWAENLIYTFLVRGAEFAATISGLRAGAVVKKGPQLRSTEKLAKEMGIDVSETGLAESVVDAARRMVPAERDANAPALREALQGAQAKQAAKVETLRQQSARQGQQIKNIDQVGQLGEVATRQLIEEGYDLAKMQTVKDILGDMEGFTTRAPGSTLAREGVGPTSTPLASLSELDILSARIEARLGKIKDDPNLPPSVREAQALKSLDKKINDWVDHQFNQDMIQGNPESIAKWRQYHDARTSGRVFNEDKVLVQLMQENATPEQINNWIFGASAAKPQAKAPAIIKRLREVLGDNHPAIIGIQQDYLHRVAAPLFDRPPNFEKFLRNFDTLVSERPTMVTDLGLQLKSLQDLRAFAETAGRVGNRRPNIFPEFERAVSQYFVGHGIARAGLRVRVSAGILKIMFGKTRPNQREILAAVTGARFGQAAIDSGSVGAGRLIQAVAIADATALTKDKRNENVEPEK